MLLRSSPMFPAYRVPRSWRRAEPSTRISLRMRLASTWKKREMRASFSSGARSSREGIWMTMGMRRRKVVSRLCSMSSVVAAMIMTLAFLTCLSPTGR